MGWNLVHIDESQSGTTKIYQNNNGEVRIDSFMGDVKNPENHDRVTLNTSNGGSLSGHGFNHEDKFDTSNDKSISKK